MRYQNSVCRRGWLHKFERVGHTTQGFLERCSRCGLQKHFHKNLPNHLYLSWHIRSILKKSDPLFAREYNQ